MGALQRLSELSQRDSRPAKLIKFGGIVECVSPNLVTVAGISQRVSLGQVLRLGENALGEVVRVESGHTYICPFETDSSCNIGDLVFADEETLPRPNQHWLGRVVNAMGQPIDALPPLPASIVSDARPPKTKNKNDIMQRARLNVPLKTGVKL